MSDPMLTVGAYLSHPATKTLWMVVELHRRPDNMVESVELENASGVWTSYGENAGAWLHRRLTRTAEIVRYEYRLVRQAPIDLLEQQVESA